MSSKRNKRKQNDGLSEKASFENEFSAKKGRKTNYQECSNLSDSDDEPAPCFSMVPKFEPKSNEILPPVGGYGKAEKMMKKQGYKSGEGLGKESQGRVEPISLSTQQGRRGVGFIPISQGKPYDGPGWDSQEEIITVKEIPIWMDESLEDIIIDENIMNNGLMTGSEKLTIDDEINFCDPKILNDILSLKTLFDTIQKEKLRTLVGKCNLYETIKKAFFMNRAALKMANLDAAFDFMFTFPKDEDDKPAVNPNEIFYFADVCAGPGGFTEYVLYRKNWRAKGFGFTLRGSNDFKLSNMFAASTETFFPYYGKKDDGNIFDPQNLISLKAHVLKYTDNKGVHLLMADGGFSVEGEENIQEIKSKQLYLCQCIAALSIVREGGNFVVKLFDIFTEFSIGLIYLMYKCFKRICIHKPVTSRPANSERYLICKWKKESCEDVERYLMSVNDIFWNNSTYNISKKDVIKLISLDAIKNDINFFKYVCNSNNRIGKEQIISLLKINECDKNSLLLDTLTYNGLTHEDMRSKIRDDCLKYWKIPDNPRKTALKPNCNDFVKILVEKMQRKSNLMNDDLLSTVLIHQPKIVRDEVDFTHINPQSTHGIESIHDWYFMFCSNMEHSKFSFYLGLGGFSVHKLDGKIWRKTEGLFLPEGTLILAEDADEKRKQGPATHSSHGLHIIDAFSLGNELIFHLCLKKRNELIKLFCESMERPQITENDRAMIPLRSKNLYQLADLTIEINNLTEKILKNGRPASTSYVPNVKDDLEKYFVVESLLFFRYCKDPWMTCYSKTKNTPYYYNKLTRDSRYDVRIDSFNHAPDSLLTYFKCQFSRDYFKGALGYLLKKCTE